MFSCGFLARFTRDRYNSLAVVAIVVGLLVFGLIITTIILHLAFLWLVLVSATVMLFTAFGYSTCTGKQLPRESLEQPSSRSESVSTISDHLAETVSIEDVPPCYEVVVTENYHVPSDSKPPSYLDALALPRFWPKAATTEHYITTSEQHPADTVSELASFNGSPPPPPYEECNTGVCTIDRLSETSISLSEEDASSLGGTSDYTVSSFSSYESLYLEYHVDGNNTDITPTHYSGIGCSSHYQAKFHLGHFPEVISSY